ncbi:MBL fold metallo-hydrolase [Cellulomonas uda]|uniref:MBL fold metallo-hydrolase n=1 Tax=Cellulomonas uda TaxID=1714 RepID=UPI001FD49EE0|nr:MBL fold metallo-hydrolase [Cellulomonas uda]NII67142.1 L-ascorbate metabolism protein UlaG (beta-lactamase superfamily) [Cellulomonas uda]
MPDVAVPDVTVPDVTVRWLGHASVVLDLTLAGEQPGVARRVRLLTDPLLRRHAGLLRRRGGAPRREDWCDADAVLVSHLHHDHAELGSLELLGATPVVAPPSNAHWLTRHGVPAVAVPEGSWWHVPGTGVRVRPVTAVHGHRPMPHRPNAAVGFLVVGPGVRVWFAGDTAPFPQMAELPALAGGPIDLALVPVGGWGPRLSGGHMDPVQAAEAVAAAAARLDGRGRSGVRRGRRAAGAGLRGARARARGPGPRARAVTRHAGHRRVARDRTSVR